MSAAEPSAVGASSQLKRQIPAFAAIGLFGFFVDAGVTYFLAQRPSRSRHWSISRSTAP
jgi:putative flippase GtrA